MPLRGAKRPWNSKKSTCSSRKTARYVSNLTKDLEQALGGQVEAREMTPEAYETTQAQVQERQWLRGG